MAVKKQIVTYPDKIIPTVRSDMMAYHKHGYTFDEYCDRNTHGRNYGKELYPFWEETKARYEEEYAPVHGNEHPERPKKRRQNRS